MKRLIILGFGLFMLFATVAPAMAAPPEQPEHEASGLSVMRNS